MTNTAYFKINDILQACISSVNEDTIWIVSIKLENDFTNISVQTVRGIEELDNILEEYELIEAEQISREKFMYAYASAKHDVYDAMLLTRPMKVEVDVKLNVGLND